MILKRTPRPRDPIRLGKLMDDISIGHVPDLATMDEAERKAFVASKAKKVKTPATEAHRLPFGDEPPSRKGR